MVKKRKYSSEWVSKLETRRQWEMYWMQQKIMAGIIEKKHNLIEMGVGSGFTSKYLKSKGFNIKTIDIDESKKPDIVCDLMEWEPNEKINGFLSFQVFEHVEFSTFEAFIQKLSSLKVRHLFISVPHNYMSKKKLFEARFKVPFFAEKYFLLTFPPFLPVKPRSKHHIWEIGLKGIGLKKYFDVYKKNVYKMIVDETLYYAQYNVFRLE